MVALFRRMHNSIISAKNLQGRENCKGFFLCDIFSGNCSRIIDSISKTEFFNSLLINEWSMDPQHGYHPGAC